ncbi:glutathione S-transferase family protein [uncultured Sulfitobacter sp.]|uniref:glutathione S-transferase family protein n=1 Tax=uncultured Sulfitobacter sp. TaxID=191468 RepID=UPI0026177A83|nr:glutathione S-transferase family protein [uncultured Sulfitobacter sp.]
MADPLRLIGFEHSVYTWAVRFALGEMGHVAAYVEANPFADPPDPVLARYTPLKRVPVLQHGDLLLTETSAILRYLDAISDGVSMQPDDPIAAAQMDQIIGIVDADVYPVMVRQVFSPGFYTPVVLGGERDDARVTEGLEGAKPALGLLDRIAGEGRQLSGAVLSLADIQLAPMMAYFLRVEAAGEMFKRYPALVAWWQVMGARPALRSTDPMAGY